MPNLLTATQAGARPPADAADELAGRSTVPLARLLVWLGTVGAAWAICDGSLDALVGWTLGVVAGAAVLARDEVAS